MMKVIRFWGSKPTDIISNLITHHSKVGTVILDPFGGGGGTIIEALKMHRRVIYNDLNPFAFFIAKNLSSPHDLYELKKAFNLLINNINSKKYPIRINGKQNFITLNWFYSTKCRCGADKEISYLTWSLLYKRDPTEYKNYAKNSKKKLEQIALRIYKKIPSEEFTHYNLRKIVKQDTALRKVKLNVITRAVNDILIKRGLLKVVGERPLRILYDSRCECGLSGKNIERTDLSKLEKIYNGSLTANYYYPTHELKYSNGEYFYKRRTISTVNELFTKRNLIALSILLNEIESLPYDKELRSAFLFCFSSILFASSKMQRPESGSWSVGCYWIPATFIERNVLKLFKSRFNNFLRWKKITNGLYKDYFILGNVDDVLRRRATLALLEKDARRLILADNCIDFIIVDPPQTDEIQYFELSFLAASWLKFNLPFENEIVVNPRQGKDNETYWNMMKSAFQEFTRVLKPGGYITVMLHGEENEYFQNIKKIFKALKLKPISSTFREYKFKNSFHKSDKKRLNGDYYITLKNSNRGLRQILNVFSHIIPVSARLIFFKRLLQQFNSSSLLRNC